MNDSMPHVGPTIEEMYADDDKAWNAGKQAFEDGKTLLDNPIDHACVTFREWRRGFILAHQLEHGEMP